MKKKYLVLSGVVVLVLVMAGMILFIAMQWIEWPHHHEEVERKKMVALFQGNEKNVGKGTDADFLEDDFSDNETGKST
jgi:hypothetical protein